MFCAEGLVLKRSNGEIFVPYYFCYEDLLDDWIKVKENTSKQQDISKQQDNSKQQSSPLQMQIKQPKVVIKDFREVMCLSQGINTNFLNHINPIGSSSKQNNKNGEKDNITKDTTTTTDAATATTNGVVLSSDQIEKALISSAIMPPRREIEMLRQFYRNGNNNMGKEFQKSRLLR